VPRGKPPKLISPAERRHIAAGAAELNYGPALEVLGITKGKRRRDRARARDMLEQVAAIYLVTDAVAGKVKDGNAREGVEETPAGQIAALEVTRRRIKAQEARGEDPNPFFPHPCDVDKSKLAPLPMELEKALATQRPRPPAALPVPLEMAIATELRAIELTADPEMSPGAKYIAAIDAAIARLKGTMSIGRKHNAELDAMIDRLEAVAFEFAPALLARRKRKRLWEFIIAFMVDAMRMKAPDVEHHRSRADKLLPERRAEQRRKMLETEQGQAVAAHWREIDKQNEQARELLRKLEGRGDATYKLRHN